MSTDDWIGQIRLFQWPILSAILASLATPSVGVFLFLRRTSFHGIALPQFAAAGIVASYAVLPWWIEHIGLGGLTLDEALTDPHAAANFSLAWAAATTLGGLALLVWRGRRGGSEIARVAVAFAIAHAAMLLFGRMSPIGRGQVDEMIQGEVLGIGVHEFETLVVVLVGALALLAWFGRDLLLVSFDRDSARVLGKRVTAFEALLHVITALVVSIGTLTLGPTLLFGLLVIPPLAARPFARSMRGFLALSTAAGLLAAVLGIALALQWDLPFGPAVVGAAALLLVPATFLRRARA